MENEQTVENTETQETQETKPINIEHESLKKLPVDELINIIAETRSEAKARRLKAKELEDRVAKIDAEKKQHEEEELSKKGEYEQLLKKYKEETADYHELKEFKTTYLEKCKMEVEENVKHLTDAEKELFSLASGKMTYDEQSQYLKKIVGTRQPSTIVDISQSTIRTNKDKEEIKSPLRSRGASDPILEGLSKMSKQN